MYILSLETSTQLGSVCLFKDNLLLDEKTSTAQRSHSDFINKAIEEVLEQNQLKVQQIDLFATGIGPGSFTGIRIALNVAKTFSYLLSKPLVVVDSLTILANQVENFDRPVLTLINAYKNMNYTAAFEHTDHGWVQIRSPEAVPVQQLDQWLAKDEKTNGINQFTVVGDGFRTYEAYFSDPLKKKLVRLDDTHDFPEGKTLGKLAISIFNSGQTMDWKSIAPLYIRASEAEENKRGLIFLPLK